MFRAWTRRTFESLALPDFRILWLGTSFAFIAFMMSWTTQSVVAFDLAGTNKAVGVVSLGSGLAMLVVGPFGGVLADRFSKRRLLLLGQSMVALTFLVIGLLILSDAITIALLVAATFVMGIAFSFTGPTRQAYVGELVPRDKLPNAVALSQMPMTVSRVVSPLLAGALIGISVIGAGGTYLFMTGLFVIVLGTLWRLPNSGRRQGPARSVRADFTAGFAHVRSRPRLRLLVLSFILLVMLGFPYQTVLPALLENELARPAREVGFMLGISAAGGLAAALAVAGLAGGRFAWPTMYGMGLLFGGALIVLAAMPTYGLALAVMVIVGVGSTGFQMLNNALQMSETEPAYYGRVMSLTMLAWGSQSLTAMPYATLADAAGERTALVVMGCAVLGLVAVSMLVAAAIGRRAEEPGLRPAELALASGVALPQKPGVGASGGD